MNTRRFQPQPTPQHDFAKPLPGDARLVDLDAGLSWYIIVTNIRGERRAAVGLARKGVASYMPVSVKKDLRSRKREPRVLALLPRYLFVGFESDAGFWKLRSVDGVESLVRFDGVPVRVPDRVIAAFVERELAGEFDETRERAPVAAFEAGQAVEVASGPLSGLVAAVARCEPGQRVQVLLDLLGRKTLAHFDVADLRSAE
jgi:transcription antitermination factor NusG